MIAVIYCECAMYRAEIELGETRVRRLDKKAQPLLARLGCWDKLDGWLDEHHPGCRWLWGSFDPDELGPLKVSSW